MRNAGPKTNYMNKIFKVTAIFAVLILLGLCMCNLNAQFGLKGSGNVIENERALESYTGIETSGGIDVCIYQGDVQKVVVVADDNLQDIIITKVEGETLKIYPEKWIRHASNIKVKVTIKDLKSVSGSGGSDVYSEQTLIVGNLSVNFSGGSDGNLSLKAIEINGTISGGSDLILKGAAGYINIEASGGSDCKAYDLIAAKANVSASGGSDIYVTVDQDIKANASGGSDIKYKGNATILKSESSGGSDIIKE